jgi:hypothetical protein
MLRASIGIAALALIALPLVAQVRGRHHNGTEARARHAMSDAANAAQAATDAADAAANAAQGETDATTNLVDAGDNMAVYGAPDGDSDNDMIMTGNMADDMSMNVTMDTNMTMDPPARRAHRRGARPRR